MPATVAGRTQPHDVQRFVVVAVVCVDDAALMTFLTGIRSDQDTLPNRIGGRNSCTVFARVVPVVLLTAFVMRYAISFSAAIISSGLHPVRQIITLTVISLIILKLIIAIVDHVFLAAVLAFIQVTIRHLRVFIKRG